MRLRPAFRTTIFYPGRTLIFRDASQRHMPHQNEFANRPVGHLQAHLREILAGSIRHLTWVILLQTNSKNRITQHCQGLGIKLARLFVQGIPGKSLISCEFRLLFLKWFSTLHALGTYWWLNCMTLLAFHDQLRATILTIIAEESGLSALGAVNGKQ